MDFEEAQRANDIENPRKTLKDRMKAYKRQMEAIKTYLDSGTYPPGLTTNEKKSLRNQAKTHVLNGTEVMYVGKTIKGPRQVVTSHKMVKEILCKYHSNPVGGHSGKNSTLEKISCHYYWAGMTADVVDYVSQCHTCQQQYIEQCKTQAPFQQFIEMSEHRQLVGKSDAMASCCIVKGCYKRSADGWKIYPIPPLPAASLDSVESRCMKERRNRWIEAAGYSVTDWKPSKHQGICSSHFVNARPSAIMGNVDWIPTLKLKLGAAERPQKYSGADSKNRWQTWASEIDQITHFLKTGTVSGQLVAGNRMAIVSAAQAYYIESGALYYKRSRKVVTAKEECDRILEEFHPTKSSDAHPDSRAMLEAIAPRYVWKDMIADVNDWIKRCNICNPDANDMSTEDAYDASLMSCADKEFQVPESSSVATDHDNENDNTHAAEQSARETAASTATPLSTAKPSSQKPPLSGFSIIKKAAIKKRASLIASQSAIAAAKHSLDELEIPSNQPADAKKDLSLTGGAYVATKPAAKKTVRPAAWLLHGVGLRMVRERVYEDLIEIQEQKLDDGQLGDNELRQLSRLQSAHADLVRKNRPISVPAKRRCRCMFAASSRYELELHRDYGQAFLGLMFSRYSCCLCNEKNIRSPFLLSVHMERVHGRQARTTAYPPIAFCPYCPYEQRTVTKNKLTRHVDHCAFTFRINANLAPSAPDMDIPLYEVPRPPTMTSAPVTAAASSCAKSSVPVSASLPGTTASMSGSSSSCVTVMAGGSVMSVGEAQPLQPKPPVIKTALRLLQLPDGLGFEICEICGAFLADRTSLAVHMARAHKMAMVATECIKAGRPLLPCEKCTEKYWTAVGLSEHILRDHKEGADSTAPSPVTTVCPLCKRTRLTDVFEHLSRQHRITLVDMFAQRYCSVCQLMLHAARPFEQHMITCHSDLFSDRASLYAAILLVDRATRGRAGMVSRGRQPAVLAGLPRKPSLEPVELKSLKSCLICELEFSDDEAVRQHVEHVHRFACTHCSRRFSSAAFLRHHVQSAHSDETTVCKLCDEEVEILSIPQHIKTNHMQSCMVSLKQVDDSRYQIYKRIGSDSDGSDVSSDECSAHENELQSKRFKLCTDL